LVGKHRTREEFGRETQDWRRVWWGNAELEKILVGKHRTGEEFGR